MMDHSRYRETVLADPHSQDAELRAHRDDCAECRAYTERLLKFESRLERAMRINLTASAQTLPFARKSAPASSTPRRWLAIAASVLLGVAIVGGVWLSLPQRSLAALLVKGLDLDAAIQFFPVDLDQGHRVFLAVER